MTNHKADYLAHFANVYTEPNTGCWLWPGTVRARKGKDKSVGYGVTKYLGALVKAHRLSFQLHKGPIPLGGHVLHKCDVPLCVNPDHLYVGDHATNMLDVKRRGRRRRLPPHALEQLRAGDRSCSEIAREFGVTPAHAQQVRRQSKGGF